MRQIEWSVFFDEGLLILIAVFLFLKGVILRRRTNLGRSWSRNNFAMSLAYIGSALSLHFTFFTTQTWRWPIRLLVAFTAASALLEMVAYFGGWSGLWDEIVFTFLEIIETWKQAGRNFKRNWLCGWGSIRDCRRKVKQRWDSRRK